MAHNHHMLAFAAMMQGESKRALDAVRTMLAGVPKEWVAVKENAAIADGFLAAPLEVMKRFGRWDDILKEPEPPELFPIARACGTTPAAWRSRRRATSKEAREEQEAFREAAKRTPKEAMFGNNMAADLFAVAEPMLEGEILAAEGKLAEAIKPCDWRWRRRTSSATRSRRTGSCRCGTRSGAFLLKDGQAAKRRRCTAKT